MKKIKQIISKYRNHKADSIILKEILIYFSALLFLLTFIILCEQTFYLIALRKIKIFNLLSSISIILIFYILLKWIIIRQALFNNSTNYKLAKEIGEKYNFIKDTFLNILQINKNNEKNSNDLKIYAIEQLKDKLINHVEPKIKIKFPKKQFSVFVIAFFLVLIFFTNQKYEKAAYRIINYKKEFDPPLPFNLTSLSGSFSALSGDTLHLSISGIGELPDSISINWIMNNTNYKKSVKHYKEVFQLSLPSVNNEIIYWANYESPSFFSSWDNIYTHPDTVTIKQRPIIRDVVFDIEPPEYTKLTSYIYNQTNVNQIEVLQGSLISLSASANKNLTKSWILNGEERLELMSEGMDIFGQFNFNENMHFSIYCIDNDYTANLNPMRYSFILKKDNPPNIVIQSPNLIFELDETLSIPIKSNVSDDFGINNIWIEYQIISPDFPNLDSQVSRFNIISNQTVISNKYIDLNWDIGNMNILMGDEIHFSIAADDKNNISGPGITKSAKIIGKFPSLENLFSRVEEYENNTEEIAEEIYDSIDEISEIAEEVRMELLKTDKLNWEQEKKIEKTFDEVDEMFKKIENIQKNIEDILEQANDNNLFDNDLLNKFEQFQDMLQSMMSEELIDAIAELQKALQNMDPKKILESLQNYEFNIEKLEEELDRFIDMFEMALAEQKLNELAEHLENMINKQTDMIEEVDNQQDNYVLEKKSTKQEKRFDDFQNLLIETKDSIEPISKETSNQIDELANNNLNKETEKILSEQTENIQNSEDRKLSKNSKEAKENLEKLSEQIDRISQQFKNESIHKMTKEFILIIDNLLAMSNQQEMVIISAADIRSNSPELRLINQKQSNIDRELNQVTKKLIELSNQTFFVSPQINRTIGKLKNAITKTVAFFEQKKISNARKKQVEILNNINEITFLLLLSMEEMQNSNSASGMEKFLESLQNMTSQQQGVNQGTMQLPQLGIGQQQSILNELMKQQQELKKQLSELLKDMAGEETGGLQKAEEEMEEVLTDFERNQISQKTIKRQQEILSKMIDSQKSLTKKDFSEKRKNKIAQETNFSDPGYLQRDLGEKDLMLINAMESAINEGLSSEYQKLIRLYFLNLQKEKNEIK